MPIHLFYRLSYPHLLSHTPLTAPKYYNILDSIPLYWDYVKIMGKLSKNKLLDKTATYTLF